MPAGYAAKLQPAASVDLDEVRIHTGGNAAAAARSLEASAFTIGNHVVFGEGAYRPGTAAGDALIAHELTHVEQQAVDGPRVQRSPDPTPRLHKRDRCGKYKVPEDPCAGLASKKQRARLPEGRGYEPALDVVAQALDMPKDSPGEYVELVKIAVCKLTPAQAADVRDSFERRLGTAGKKFGELSTASRCKILFALDARVAEGVARKREILEETIAEEQKAEARRKEKEAETAQRRREEQAKRDRENFEKAGRTDWLSALMPLHTRAYRIQYSNYIQDPLLKFNAGVAERAASVPLAAAVTEPVARPIATILEFLECMFMRIRGESVDAIFDSFRSHPIDALEFPFAFNKGVVIGMKDEIVGIAELIKDLITDPLKMLEEAEKLLKLLWSPNSFEIACALGQDLGEHFDKHLLKLAGQGPSAIGEELGKLAGPFVFWTLVSLVAPYITAAVKGTKLFKRLLKLLKELGESFPGIEKLIKKKKKHHGDGGERKGNGSEHDTDKPPESEKPPEGGEGMGEGTRTVGEKKHLEIDGEHHELFMVDEQGRISFRLCSDDCGPVVEKLRVTRDAIPDTPENAAVRTKLADLMKEGEQLEASFNKTSDRKTWNARASEYAAKLEAAAKEFPKEMGSMAGARIPVPGDVDYKGKVPPKSWRITPKGEGAHLIERVNTKGRSQLAKFDKANTPRFYPDGTPEQAGQAHLRIHDATKNAEIKLQGGNPSMTDDQLLNAYRKAYSDPSLDGIRGDLRLPDGTVVAKGVTVKDAFEKLLNWGGL